MWRFENPGCCRIKLFWHLHIWASGLLIIIKRTGSRIERHIFQSWHCINPPPPHHCMQGIWWLTQYIWWILQCSECITSCIPSSSVRCEVNTHSIYRNACCCACSILWHNNDQCELHFILNVFCKQNEAAPHNIANVLCMHCLATYAWRNVYQLNPKTAGGGGGGWINPPLDIFRDHSAARNFLTAPLADFLLSSLAHLMTPFSRKSGIPLRRCTTFYTSSSDQKWLKNVILCTKSMQMEFSHLIHKDMIIFTFIRWNQFILA